MTINSLLSNLLQRTQDDSIEWSSPSSGTFRYVSNQGAVAITRYQDSSYYAIKLYDLDHCFAEYNTVDNPDLLVVAADLYDAICSSNERAIERKISDVFSFLS